MEFRDEFLFMRKVITNWFKKQIAAPDYWAAIRI